jgi:ATP-dependent RNA helicase DDX31/DBP7
MDAANNAYENVNNKKIKMAKKSTATNNNNNNNPLNSTSPRTLCELFTNDKKATRQTAVFKLHGSIDHRQRLQTYSQFLAAESAILFTTDVAARGLDLPKVTHILQYDVPLDIPSYLHRMGRTARLGGQGEGLLWLMPNEVPYLDLLAKEGVVSTEKSMAAILRRIRY